MYARVVTVQSQPGKTEETIRIYRDFVMPVSKQQQGFKGAFLLTDPNTGKGVSITLWETEADMRAGEASGYYQEQIAKFAQVFAGPPTREGYEVSVQV
jgi:heme-degrading monooxygenase HmoA